MDTSFDQQRLSEYQKRFAEWMTKQGVFFRLRHARVIGGHSIMSQLGSLMARLLIVVIALLGLGYVAVSKYFGSETYQEKISEGIKESMGLENIEVDGFQRRGKSGFFHDIEMQGGPDSFFYKARVDGLTGGFDFLTGVNSSWNPKTLRMEKGEFEIKAGGEGDEMDKAFLSLVDSLEGKGLESLSINTLNLDWGYSKLTYGRIEGTDFGAQLVDGVWDVELSGGKFRQNWLRDFTIESGSLSVHSGGITVHSLDLSKDGATLTLTGDITGPVERPQFNLAGEFEHLPVEKMFELSGVQISEFISGKISGSLKITGSTDTRIEVEGEAKLGPGDVITIRERWPILRAISVLDLDRSYRRLDFKEGEFKFKTSNGGAEISEVRLFAGDLSRLEGSLVTRLPSQKEAAETLGIVLTEGFAGSFDSDYTDTTAAERLEEARMSLKGAAGGGGRVVDFKFDDEKDEDRREVLPPGNSRMNPKEVESMQLLQEMNVHRVTGQLRLAIPADALSDYPQLLDLYPVDEEGWRWVDIKVESSFSKISTKAHDQILEKSLGKKFESEPE